MPKNKALILAMLDRETTQIKTARQTGIHQSRLNRIVNGHDEATPDEKKALAKALRRPVAELFPEQAVTL